MFIVVVAFPPIKAGKEVEFENRETFMAMHGSSIHAKAREQVMPLFDGKPTPHFYEVVVG